MPTVKLAFLYMLQKFYFESGALTGVTSTGVPCVVVAVVVAGAGVVVVAAAGLSAGFAGTSVCSSSVAGVAVEGKLMLDNNIKAISKPPSVQVLLSRKSVVF